MADTESLNEQLNSAAVAGERTNVLRPLDQGADISAKDSLGRTPLINAAAYDHSETVKALLDRGADPSLTDDMGFTPAEVASMNGHTGVADLIKRHGGRGDTASLHRRVTDSIKDSGASVTTLYPNASSEEEVLVIAAGEGDIDTVRTLLKKGVEANVSVQDGVTALMAVCTTSHVNVAEALLDAGADPNGKDDRGVTPLMGAAFSNQVSMVRLLLYRGGDIRARSNEGFTASDLAANQGHSQVMKLLQQAPAREKQSKPWWKFW